MLMNRRVDFYKRDRPVSQYDQAPLTGRSLEPAAHGPRAAKHAAPLTWQIKTAGMRGSIGIPVGFCLLRSGHAPVGHPFPCPTRFGGEPGRPRLELTAPGHIALPHEARLTNAAGVVILTTLSPQAAG